MPPTQLDPITARLIAALQAISLEPGAETSPNTPSVPPVSRPLSTSQSLFMGGTQQSHTNHAPPPQENNTWYSITKGRAVGVMRNWAKVHPLVDGLPDNRSRCKRFPTKAEAISHFRQATQQRQLDVYLEPDGDEDELDV